MCEMLKVFLYITFFCSNVVLSEDEGWTYPSQPILQEVGSEIRIMCGVNGNKYHSKDLGFFNGTDEIDRRFVREINSSAIQLIIPNASEQDSSILCKVNGQHGISYNDVKIGHKPVDILDVKCLSQNWQDMNCTFEKPYNPIPVQYTLRYRIKGSHQIYPCTQPKEKHPHIFWCYIQTSGYRKTNERFEIILESLNDLSKAIPNKQIIDINNFASVIPAAPENFEELETKSDYVVLKWNVNSNIVVFPKPFDYEFLIQSGCEPEKKRLRFYEIPSMDKNESPMNNTRKLELKFANTWYVIQIRMKISTAPEVEEMWSKWVVKQFTSGMRPPDNPPSVAAGSFSIGESGDVHIYWKHLPKCYQNGHNYTYVITSSNKNSEKPIQTTHSAIYKSGQVDLSMDTTITIYNTNSMGPSKERSYLVIPGRNRRLAGPIKIKKFLKNGIYQLSWSPPDRITEKITSYTVYHCLAISELTNSCEGSIDFVHLDPSTTHFVYETPKSQSVNFAVSANSETSTSGMIWAMCTTANSNDIGKIKTIWIPKLRATEIEVEWKLECTDSGIVAGYQLEYCPISEPKTLECIEQEKKMNITDGLENPKYTLKGLTPYTTYKIVIRMFSNSTMGPASDPLANTTLEAGN
jgi:cytokine receptor domeless